MKLPSAARNLALGLCAVLYSASLAAAAQSIDLPEGLTSQVAAAPPLVTHPIMATLGPRGQLFVGDAAGTNLNKAGLEKQLPNRVLLLTDTNGDGVYDRASVFADFGRQRHATWYEHRWQVVQARERHHHRRQTFVARRNADDARARRQRARQSPK